MNQSKLDALEILERQRRGEKVDIGIREEAPLFEDVNEEDYKRTRKSGFIVDPEEDDDNDIDDSDLDFIDDEFDDLDAQRSGAGGCSSRDNVDRRGSKRKRKEVVDPKQRSVRSFLSGTSSIPSVPKGDKKQEVDQDDILNQMLFDVPENKTSSAKKPIRVMSLQTTRKEPSSATKKPRLLNSSCISTSETSSKSATAERTSLMTVDDKMTNDDDFYGEMNTQQSVDCELQGVDLAMTDDFEESTKDDDNNVTLKIDYEPLSSDIKTNHKFDELPDGRNYTTMYWYDCCEDQQKHPGFVYFFGRIKVVTSNRYVSCCAIVNNVPRTNYLLITEDSTYEQAENEFKHIIAKRYRIRNAKCEKVTKKYAFADDPNIPVIGEYLKVDYPANQGPLPADLKGETFSHVFNINQTPMEKLILELKLRGPCWLRLIDPVASHSPLTWTQVELVLEKPENLQVEEDYERLGVPYFCAFSLSLRTYSNPHTQMNEIIAIAGMVNTTFNLDECLKRTNKASGHFMIMTRPASTAKDLKLPYDALKCLSSYNKTKFTLVDSERDLLVAFMEKFEQLDPDIVIGHDLINFDYETLVGRMSNRGVGKWAQLGRFKRTQLPSTKSAFKYMFSGRVLCDIRSSAMELIRARSYDLTELVSQVLGKTRTEYNHAALIESYRTSSNLIKMLNATWEDTDSIFSILVELNIIPLALKITNITGNILSRTLAAGRSERNEYLLLHAFHEQNFICPEKQVAQNKFGRKTLAAGDDALNPIRRKAAYAGGLVLEPKAGFYDTCVLLMDFNSLYPSIIQEFNICFSTVKAPISNDTDTNGELIASLPDDSAPQGVLPSQLRNLVERRRKVKQMLAETKLPTQKMLLDIEQKALKLTANSMYGCLGFEQSRFYAKHLASLVTFKGREILMSTKAMVEKLGYDVIYGDTDSLMIDTKLADYDEVIQRGLSIKSDINKLYKLLEIDIDGVYRPLLLLKKKNYAGASVKKIGDNQFQTTIETKGLDTVRRDRAVIAKEAGERVLSMILESQSDINQVVEDIHNYLKQLGLETMNDSLPKEKYLISKQLNRNPEEYRNTKGIGHVVLAQRYNADPKKARKLKAGDTVEYVVCTDGTGESANQRAYSMEELLTRDELKIDYEYYLCQQIHPVIARICDKLPVTNAYVLAEMLGVEKSSMLHLRREESDVTRRDQLASKGEARFASCKPLQIQCPNCNLFDEISSRTRKNADTKKWELSLSRCKHCNRRYANAPNLIIVQMICLIKRLTLELYSSKLVCENPDCDYETRNLFRPLTSDGNAASGDGTNEFAGVCCCPGEGSDEAGAAAAPAAEASTTLMKAQAICQSCSSLMVPEMDDRKMDLQLSFVKHLLDVNRELAIRGSDNNFEQPVEEILDFYTRCHKEIDYALRCSVVNNVDAFSIFSMVCSNHRRT